MGNCYTHLGDFSYIELEHFLCSSEHPKAILPIGAVEQHGPHLPLNTDSIIGQELASRISRVVPETVVAPPIPVGCSQSHENFIGTISIPPDLLMDLLKQYTISLENHGFEYVLLLPSHGGNFAPVDSAAAEISRTLEKLDLIPLTDLPGYMSLLNQGLAEFGIEYEESVVHAGATETSMVMAVDEDKVRSENIELGNEAEITYGEVLAHGFSDLTQNGVLGDPRKADPEAGETIFEIIVDEYVENIEKQISSIEP